MNIKNISIYALIALSSLQLHGMQNQSKQYSPRPQINLPLVNNKLPSLKRASEDPLDFTGLEKKAKIDNPSSYHSQEKTNTSLEKEQGSQPYPIIITSPEEEQGSQVCPIAIDSQDENRQIEPLQITFSARIKQTIYDLDLITFGQLLVSNNATQLTKEEKETLHKCAKDQKVLFEAINDLVKQTKSQEIKTKYSSDSEYQKIQKISRHLYAFKTLPKLTFPQYFTPNIPYAPNPTPKTTPDTALLALIKNEQEKISVCCHSFDFMPIAQALIRKKDKNKDITIEVITDQQQAKYADAHKIVTLFRDNGIEVLAPQNDKQEIMHHKFSLFSRNLLNKSLVCEGSFNYTDSATRRNWEFIEISDTPEKVEFFNNEFTTVKNRSTKLPTIQPIRRNNNNNNIYPKI